MRNCTEHRSRFTLSTDDRLGHPLSVHRVRLWHSLITFSVVYVISVKIWLQRQRSYFLSFEVFLYNNDNDRRLEMGFVNYFCKNR